MTGPQVPHWQGFPKDNALIGHAILMLFICFGIRGIGIIVYLLS